MSSTPDAVLAAWRLWQQAQSLSKRTIDEREIVMRSLLAASGAKPLKVRPGDIISFCSRETLSESTRSTYHASIRAFSEWLVKSGQRKDDPTALTPTPRRPKSVPRPITTEQFIRILEKANRRRTRTMILLAAYAGLRVHEIAKIRGEDIDLYSMTLTVVGKGNKLAVTALHPVLAAAAETFPRRGYLFPSYARTGAKTPHVAADAVHRAIKGAMVRAEVDATPHQIRHWYGTELLAGGVDIRIVKDLMRHESVATTQIYTKVDMPQLHAGIVALPVPEQLAPVIPLFPNTPLEPDPIAAAA